METLKTKSLVWHHMRRPAQTDLGWLKEEFGVHPLVLEQLGGPTMRPKLDDYDNFLYLVLHFPIFHASERKTYPREIDFILMKKHLVTVAYESIPPLDDFFRSCATEKSFENLYASKTPAHLLYYIVRELYAFALRELDHIQEHIDRIEDKIFLDGERGVIEEISIVRRDIIDFRRALKPQQAALESLAEQGTILHGPGVKHFLDGLVGEYMKVWNLIENNKEALDALYDNNVTILSIKQNEAMRFLTIGALLTFPPMLFVALMGMDAFAKPVIGGRYDFWIVLGIIAVMMTAMLAFFRRKDWL